jgi:KaiC/GvpD/RAD55 family RecA-like ATPase
MIEEKIVKLFCLNKEHFTKYGKSVKLDYIKYNYSNIFKLFNIINIYYNKYIDNNNITLEDLESCYVSNYFVKEAERKDLVLLLHRIFDAEVNEELAIDYLEEHRKRSLAGRVAEVALDVQDGKASVDSLLELFGKFEQSNVEVDEPTPVDLDLEKLFQSQVAAPGLRWRLDSLNKSLGSLRKGDFGFVFARPETGKTTFLASECTHMVTQTEGDVLWFNNEEQGGKVAIRCYQAALGLETDRLFKDRPLNDKLFKEQGGSRLKIFDTEDSSSVARIEQVIKTCNPALIIFDQIDKIKGFKTERYDLELKAIYQWAREIAKKYAPVIAVCQANGDAEGKLWLTMDMVDSSRTAKQGEADWILGIGREQDQMSNYRYLNISKNKLLGDEDTDAARRHGGTQVIIRPEVARYLDF